VIVVDASIVAAWFFSDEADEVALSSSQRVLRENAVVPPIFPAEVANALFFARRRGRIPKNEFEGAFERIKQLPIMIDSQGFDLDREVALSTRYNLSVYDAMYLALAQRRRIVLLTRDRDLHAAALDAGVAER
jgi:predicted nucleic acid-binding protein